MRGYWSTSSSDDPWPPAAPTIGPPWRSRSGRRLGSRRDPASTPWRSRGPDRPRLRDAHPPSDGAAVRRRRTDCRARRRVRRRRRCRPTDGDHRSRHRRRDRRSVRCRPVRPRDLGRRSSTSSCSVPSKCGPIMPACRCSPGAGSAHLGRAAAAPGAARRRSKRARPADPPAICSSDGSPPTASRPPSSTLRSTPSSTARRPRLEARPEPRSTSVARHQLASPEPPAPASGSDRAGRRSDGADRRRPTRCAPCGDARPRCRRAPTVAEAAGCDASLEAPVEPDRRRGHARPVRPGTARGPTTSG